MSETGRDPQAFVRSFARGLAIVEAMGREPGRFTLTELATATGINPAAARRVLLTLVELGYCAADGRYFRPTPRTLGLGISFLHSLPFWRCSQLVLEELRNEVGRTSFMAVLDGAEAVLVLWQPARRILMSSSGIGSRLPAHATAFGRVLLAGLPAERFEAYLARSPREAFTAHTLTEPGPLRAEIARVREQGYAWGEGDFDPAICGLSVPLRNGRREVVAAICISAITGTVSEAEARTEFLVPLRRAAQEIQSRSPD